MGEDMRWLGPWFLLKRLEKSMRKGGKETMTGLFPSSWPVWNTLGETSDKLIHADID